MAHQVHDQWRYLTSQLRTNGRPIGEDRPARDGITIARTLDDLMRVQVTSPAVV
jgi:hypothetical protein